MEVELNQNRALTGFSGSFVGLFRRFLRIRTAGGFMEAVELFFGRKMNFKSFEARALNDQKI